MSQVSVSASRFANSPRNFANFPRGTLNRAPAPNINAPSAIPGLQHRALSPGQESVAASRFDPIETRSVDTAALGSSGGLGSGGIDVAAIASAANNVAIGAQGSISQPQISRRSFRTEPDTPNSAAGSRFPDSPTSYATSALPLSPTAIEGGGGGGPYTGRSAASSMRSGSFFQDGTATSSSLQSAQTGSGRAISTTSVTSWDEEDIQNIGARWLSDRAYNQKYAK